MLRLFGGALTHDLKQDNSSGHGDVQGAHRALRRNGDYEITALLDQLMKSFALAARD